MSEENPSYLNVVNWRVSSPAEVLEFADPPEPKDRRPTRSALAIRKYLKPIDVYTYLKARFGEPNGFQNFLRRDDSDNLVHWDFNVKAGETDIWIFGTAREVQIVVTDDLTDSRWRDLILAIRDDYQRVHQEKSQTLRTLEKYLVFQNKYVSLAGLCARLHEEITAAESYSWPDTRIDSENRSAVEAALKSVSRRADSLYGNCLTLRLVTPVMAEAYINMMILIFCKNSVRDDAVCYNNLLRSKIPERLKRLPDDCDGFVRSVDTSTEAYVKFMQVINRRNFALHGNVDPVREKIEVVYFDERRPIFSTPGNHIERFYQNLESLHDPDGVIADYEAVHLFLIEVADCLSVRHRRFFDQVISDGYPGYEVRKKRVTRILPDHVVLGMMEGLRYDEDLDVVW